MHEEPIVYSADDAVRGFLDGHLDYLAIGSHIVKHPQAVTHPLRPVIAAAPRDDVRPAEPLPLELRPAS